MTQTDKRRAHIEAELEEIKKIVLHDYDNYGIYPTYVEVATFMEATPGEEDKEFAGEYDEMDWVDTGDQRFWKFYYTSLAFSEEEDETDG